MGLQASAFVWRRFNLLADVRSRKVTERTVISSLTTLPRALTIWRKSRLKQTGQKGNNAATQEPRESEVRGSGRNSDWVE